MFSSILIIIYFSISSPINQVLEFLIPLIGILVLVWIRALVKVDDVETGLYLDFVESVPDENAYDELMRRVLCGHQDSAPRCYIAYAPNNDPFMNGMISDLRSKLLDYANEPHNSQRICCGNNFVSSATECNDPTTINVPDYINNEIFKGFPSEAAMVAYTTQDRYGWFDTNRPLVMGWIFDTAHIVDDKITYKVRLNRTSMPATFSKVDKLLAGFDAERWASYYRSGTVLLKHWIDQHVIEQFSPGNTANVPEQVTFAPFPVAAHKQDNFESYVGSIVGLFYILAFMWPFSRFVRNIVDEKERRIKEGMAMMGLRNSVFWCSWAITYLIVFFVFSVLATLLSKPTLFKYSNGLIIFLYFFLFSTSLVAMALLVTAFFNRAKSAGTLSSFCLLVAYLPIIAVQGDSSGVDARSSASLLSPVAFSLTTRLMLKYESAFIGATFSNISEVTDNYAVSVGLWLMLFDTIIYGVLAWYLDNVLPKEYGTPLPWYFVFLPAYWCGSKGKSTDQTVLGLDDTMSVPGTPRSPYVPIMDSPYLELDDGSHADSKQRDNPLESPLAHVDHNSNDGINPDPEYVEAVPDATRNHLGVELRALRKVFPGKGDLSTTAVHGLNLEMYRGQIFVLLGHNGAGKSTTINMLSGMTPATRGTALINGLDINHDMADIRQTLGVCPQHDILWDSLTVREHLEFFGRLKGLSKNELKPAVELAIQEVQLEQSADLNSAALSGGQKRRLSLAISLIGDSRIVFLDEPTSGVDAFSRRAIWELLNQKKHERVIVLTTHFMDEADQLGDRIGIMHGGKLRCVGSPLFLKRKFGVGYTLTVTKQPQSDSAPIQQAVLEFVHDAKPLSDVGTEVSFQLPLASSSSFSDMLRRLDGDSEQLGVSNYGLSVTTLEEVFLRVATDDEVPDDRLKAQDSLRRMSVDSSGSQGDNNSDLAALSADDANRGFCRDFHALLAKRYHISKRDKRMAICQFLVPILLLVFGLGLLRVNPDFKFPQQFLTPAIQYGDPARVPYNAGPVVPGYTSIVNHMDSSVQMQGFTGVSSLTDFSTQLLNKRDISPIRSYGAYFLDNMNPSTGGVNFTVYSNVTGFQAMPTFQNAANQALLRNLTGNTNAAINLSVQPFAFTAQERSLINSLNGFFSAIVIALAYCFVPATVAVFVVKEREIMAKHLQQISGVSTTAYWAANFVWDFANFLIPALVGAVVILIFSNPNFTGDNFGVIFVGLLSYGLAVIPFTYMMSFLFKSHSTAQNVMIMIYLGAGIALLLVSFALFLISSTRDLNNDLLRHLFRLFPNFCLSDIVFWMSIRTQPFVRKSRWDLDVAGYDIIFLLVEAVVYSLAVILIEYLSLFPNVVAMCNGDPTVPSPDIEEDVDVLRERERIRSGQATDDMLTVEGVRKTFRPQKVAVRDLWFGIPRGQCFGFLGVNGAGKTTTMKVITGDLNPSQGDVFVGGLNIFEHPQRVRRLMGYCPQFDALHEHMTAEETLQLFGRIRGVPEHRLNRMVQYLIRRLTLTKYAKRPAGTYSGGNKRKLSVGIALIGNPSVVLLDEPSTGMDPVSRRFMWDFIADTMSNRSVILVTHSMEECEALCQRIGIIVRGSLHCIGSAQHLKNRFGNEYQLDIGTGSNGVDAARQFVYATFTGAREVEAHGSKLKFALPHQPDLSLAEIFSVIESKKEEVGITEYAVGQTTLEQIFVKFAKDDDEANSTASGSSIGTGSGPSHHSDFKTYEPPSIGTGSAGTGSGAAAGAYQPLQS
jgi:ATP-binding cassette, subfamily A (ABC1), member 3